MVLDALDWERITRTHGERWTLKEAGRRGYRYVVSMGDHAGAYLARLIVGAGPGEAVVFRNGDALDLCRGNLEVRARHEAVRRAFGR